MTVKKLIELLQRCNENDLVILAKDSEGNGFSPLHEITPNSYIPDNTWSGRVEPRTLTPAIEQSGNDCITLWPVN